MTRISTILAILAIGVTFAENIDPDADGSQFAYGENVGWLNAEPTGGDGLTVGEFAVTGYLWGENVGWVSFSCENDASCGSVPYGVENDGGLLSGMAWSENVGWISLSCATAGDCGQHDYGVTIDTESGLFAGHAWAENVGWISFDVDGAIKTEWSCQLPEPVVGLAMEKFLLGLSELSWPAAQGASAYDVIRGDLGKLLGTSGAFDQAASACLAENSATLSQLDNTAPEPGEALWYLVRAADCGGGSANTSGVAQLADRDAGLELADPADSCL